MNKFLNADKNKYIVWLLPVAFFTIQSLPPQGGLVAALLLLLFACACKNIRKSLLLLLFSVCGYLVWQFASPLISADIKHPELSQIAGRIGLVGYILLFGAWHFFSKPKNRLLQMGNAKAIIQLPCIWKGKKEPMWRFILIFSLICTLPFLVGIGARAVPLPVLLYGLLFSVINACFEEIIWRGLILARTMDMVSELHALLITALSFGLYHLSLGFSAGACALFAVGGFYMGGAAIKSKGLLAPFIMHVFVNMAFVAWGLIF